ncbi:hypothetical protein Scep_015415 [Stephania cephalantha]|uniref:Transmembrane protein n=1 Tax=Stephania cephalantha TaxID=152367 RepID=A0AAP0J347_9MAGN
MNTGFLICFFIICFHALSCASTLIPQAHDRLDCGHEKMAQRKAKDCTNGVKHVMRAKAGRGAHAGGSNMNRHHPFKDSGARSLMSQSSLILLTVLQVNIGFILAFLFSF